MSEANWVIAGSFVCGFFYGWWAVDWWLKRRKRKDSEKYNDAFTVGWNQACKSFAQNNRNLRHECELMVERAQREKNVALTEFQSQLLAAMRSHPEEYHAFLDDLKKPLPDLATLLAR